MIVSMETCKPIWGLGTIIKGLWLNVARILTRTMDAMTPDVLLVMVTWTTEITRQDGHRAVWATLRPTSIMLASIMAAIVLHPTTLLHQLHHLHQPNKVFILDRQL